MPASNPKAVTKLQPSHLYSQNQLMVTDVELASLNLALRGSASISIVEAVTEAEVTRTIEGASTVVITVLDRDREILNSGRLAKKTDIKIDGLWFRLSSFTKTGDYLELTFEDREVALMRTYKKHIVAVRKTQTRTRFIKRMVNEVKEVKIPFVCPEISKLPPIRVPTFDSGAKSGFDYEKNPGFGGWGGFAGDITVRGLTADPVQMENTARVLNVGVARGASWSVLVSAVEVINEESNARNLPYSGDGLSVGLFQQRFDQPPDKYWGTKEELLDIEHASNLYFDQAIRYYNANPKLSPEEIAQQAQHVMYMDHIVALWRTFRDEAERTVARYGAPKGAVSAGIGAKSKIEDRQAAAAANAQDVTDADKNNQAVSASGSGSFGVLQLESEDYQFSRGTFSVVDGQKVLKMENTWECSGRLAEEINWRRFMVSGTFYLMSEPYMFRSNPIMKIDEESPGVLAIDGDYTLGKKNASVKVTCHLHRWEAPPGSMVEVFKVGPLSGRWLVSEIRRSLFETTAEISLKKPRPVLKEPNLDQESALTYSLAEIDSSVPTTEPGPGMSSSDSTTIPVDRSKALEVLRTLINNKRITFDVHPPLGDNDRQGLLLSGSVLRKDGTLVPIDTQVIKFLVWAGDTYGIRVSSLVGTHPQFVAGSDDTRESRHWTGFALDIGTVPLPEPEGRVDSPSNKNNVMGFMRAVAALAPGLKPDQMICNGCGYFDPDVQALQLDNGLPKGGVWVSDHINHIHIGY